MLNRLPWPLPALLSWALAWACVGLAQGAGLAGPWALGLGTLAGVALAALQGSRMRRLLVALGLPVSALALGVQGGASGLLWLLPLALLWWLYPRRSWADAPVFPTPRGALTALPAVAALEPGARVLDAGCGAGDGLRELARAYPQARVEGVEWSRPLVWLARGRARGTQVRCGDLWADDWAPYALVYVFQRPESMARVWAKACAELAPSAWLVSLDFPIPEATPVAHWALPSGQPVWVYQPVQ